ncbi:MAG: hypothetical protein PHC61_03020, partial [Chitinivibrionales bacterium]|nr:hypothetical protein [Chitinivibrionales bacterium]
SSNDKIIFAYSSGATLANSTPASGRRLGFSMADAVVNGYNPGIYSAKWWNLVKQCLRWCETGIQQ